MRARKQCECKGGFNNCVLWGCNCCKVLLITKMTETRNVSAVEEGGQLTSELSDEDSDPDDPGWFSSELLLSEPLFLPGESLASDPSFGDLSEPPGDPFALPIVTATRYR